MYDGMSGKSCRILLFVCCLLDLCSCIPTPKVIDSSDQVNAGVNIVPDAVLASQKITPSSKPSDSDLPDLVDVISDSDQKHYTMIELLRESGMITLLQQTGPYTVLAPTDSAFGKLPPGVVNGLLLPTHHQQLVAFVKYHILRGSIGLTDMLQTNGQIPTLGGSSVVVKGIDNKAMINDSNIVRSDTAASNGVVHWIDSVLLPPV